MNTIDYQNKRKTLLDQMAEIERMREGRLSEEYRERVVDGQTIRNGPYYKHQLWKDGKNVSRRVPAEEAQRLREGIEGMDRDRAQSGFVCRCLCSAFRVALGLGATR